MKVKRLAILWLLGSLVMIIKTLAKELCSVHLIVLVNKYLVSIVSLIVDVMGAERWKQK